jgi:hypothetical protein
LGVEFARRDFFSENNIRRISSVFSRSSFFFSSDKYEMLLAMINCVSNSLNEPSAIHKKWKNSLLPFLDCHSAIFEGIDTAARRIWEVIQKISSFGKEFVIQ